MKFLISIVLIWIGAILSISFFETPLKFTPEVITTELGVSIGRVIFFFFNKIEIVFTVLMLIAAVRFKKEMSLILPILVAIIILVQTFLILPALDFYAVDFIENGIRGPKSWHWAYVLIEFVKLLSLIILAVMLFKKFELKSANK